MNKDELRAAQAPLKAIYREEPRAALTAVAAEAAFAEPVTVTVEGWAGPVRAGLHRATGGDGSDACSGDMLMVALVACAGVSLHSVATAYGVELGDVTLRASGTFDARGTLGIDREADVGVQRVSVVAWVDSPADDAMLGRLAAATERFCVVGQSLKDSPTFEVRRR